MARSKEQTTGPFPQRLTRAQRAAARRSTTAESPKTDDPTATMTTAGTPPLDTAPPVVEETTVTISRPTSPGVMSGRHFSRSQILAARRHSIAAATAKPNTTLPETTPVTGDQIHPKPPPTILDGAPTTATPSHPPLTSTLIYPYSMAVVDNAHIVITHHHPSTTAGTSTAGTSTAGVETTQPPIKPTQPTHPPDDPNPNPKTPSGEVRDFDLNVIGATDEDLENVQPLVDRKMKKPMVISTPKRVTRSAAAVLSDHRRDSGGPSTRADDSMSESSSHSSADDSVSDEPYEDHEVADEPPPKRTRRFRRHDAEQVQPPLPTFQQRYDALLDKKLHMERGFSIALVEGHDFIKSHLESHGWLDLVTHPYRVNVTLVREFYAAFVDTEGDIVMVREKAVLCSSRTLNATLGLDPPGLCAFARYITGGISEDELKAIADLVCLPGHSWTKDGNRDIIRTSHLNFIASLWFQFLRHNVMPSSHDSTVPRDKCILLYCILKDMPINVGPILRTVIGDVNTRCFSRLMSPGVITRLCLAHDVPEYKTDTVQYSSSQLDQGTIARMLRSGKFGDMPLPAVGTVQRRQRQRGRAARPVTPPVARPPSPRADQFRRPPHRQPAAPLPTDPIQLMQVFMAKMDEQSDILGQILVGIATMDGRLGTLESECVAYWAYAKAVHANVATPDLPDFPPSLRTSVPATTRHGGETSRPPPQP